MQFSRNHIAARVAIEPPDEWPVNTIRFSSATALDTSDWSGEPSSRPRKAARKAALARADAGVRGGGGHPAGGGPGRREGEGGAGVRVGRVVHLEGGGGGGGRRGAGHGREGERGAVGDEQAVVVGQRRRARGRSVHRHRAGESQWN